LKVEIQALKIRIKREVIKEVSKFVLLPKNVKKVVEGIRMSLSGESMVSCILSNTY